MRLFSILCALVLTGCMSSDERLMAQHGRPNSVLKHVPEGIPSSAVGLQSGCYLYDDSDGNPVFVTDENGDRICVK
ncbi:MAG: hypothetical protein ABJL99_18950 [Aliishimia sp.]